MDGLAIFGIVLLGIVLVVLAYVGLTTGEFGNSDDEQQEAARKPRGPRAQQLEEIDDLGQMLEATNARRRALGQEELTAKDAAATLVPEDERVGQPGAAAGAPAANASAELDDIELQHALTLRNAELRRQGKPEMTADELRALMNG